MLWLFLWIAWFMLLFRVIVDIFRSHDMGGWGKALWAIFVIVVPFLGVFVYLIARGHAMADRDVEQAQAQRAAFDAYVRDAAGSERRDRRRAVQARRPEGAGRDHRRRVRAAEGQAPGLREPMNIVWAALIVAAATAVAVAAMLAVRRRAPEGGYFADSDRAAGIFGVLATGFSVLLGFLIFLGFESYDASRAGAETEALTVAQQIQTAQFLPAEVGAELTGELVCYARSVIDGEWDRMEDGSLGEDINPWGVAMFRTLQGVELELARPRRRPTGSGWTRRRTGRGPPGPHPRRRRADADAAVDRPVLHLGDRARRTCSGSPTAASGRGSRRCSWAAWSP